jgi:signal transduction histidine kinase
MARWPRIAGFQIAVEAEPGLHVALHRELIGQALGNLIENATKYALGGHRITVRAAAREWRDRAFGGG